MTFNEPKLFDSREKLLEFLQTVPVNFTYTVTPGYFLTVNGNYNVKYVVTFMSIVNRTVEELIGTRSIEDVQREVIEIQRRCRYQWEVSAELYRRYMITPPEANLIYNATSTNVPSRYKALWEYKEKNDKWDKRVPWYIRDLNNKNLDEMHEAIIKKNEELYADEQDKSTKREIESYLISGTRTQVNPPVSHKPNAPATHKEPLTPEEMYKQIENMKKIGRSLPTIAFALNIELHKLYDFLDEHPELMKIKKEKKPKSKKK